METIRHPGSRLVAIAVAAVLAGSCARNPVTGKRELAFVSQNEEIQLGKQASAQVARSVGLYPDEKVQQYVASVAKPIAARSERPNLPWTFQVLDDPAVNAFALPGGPVFVTRGLLTHLNSEAELAGVLGHEIGHITYRHSVEQITKAQLAQVGVGLAGILKPELRKYQGIAGAGLQLLMLKNSRGAENEADSIGLDYLAEAGYAPDAMVSVLSTLARVGEASGSGKLPGWLSTHPEPASRVARIQKELAGVGGSGAGVYDRQQYLAMVDGMPYGDDPRQGYFKGNTFIHPLTGFAVDLPEGWKAQNGAAALVAASPREDAAMQLGLVPELPPQEAAQKFYQLSGVKFGKVVEFQTRGSEGVASYFSAGTESGPVAGIVSFTRCGDRTCQLLAYSEPGRLRSYDDTFVKVINSFRQVSDPALLNVQPNRVELTTAEREQPFSELAASWGSPVAVEKLAIINGVAVDSVVRPGQRLKRVR